MKNNVFKFTIKYLPLYLIAIVCLFAIQYISSLTTVFVGEVLAIFNDEEHILPSFFIKYLNQGSKYDMLISVCVMYIVIAVCGILFRLIQGFTRVGSTRLAETNLSVGFFSHVLHLPKSYLTTHSTGDIIQRNIQDVSKFTSMFSDGLFHFIQVIFAITTVFMQMFSLSKVNFYIGLALGVVVVVVGIFVSFFYVRKKEVAMSDVASKRDASTQQSFSNIDVVKSFANEEVEKEKFNKVINEYENINYDLQISYSKYWLIMDGISLVYTVLSYVSIGLLYFNSKIGLGAATSLIMLNSTVVLNCTNLVKQINHVIRNSVSIKRLNEYLKVEEDFVIDGYLTPDIDGNIEFDNVSMYYEDDKTRDILIDITFSVKKGETLGIVGKSGSGKSTLINILTRLDDYQKGSIKIDGVELKDIKKKHLRENMSIVNQESFVFAKSIKDNLTILTKKDVNYFPYVDSVCLTEDINKMNDGYETIVGERGVTLSGGQRQRISIARSLMKNKNILILDDSLSALDNNVAKAIKSQLKKNKCTTLIISHNLMNIMDADKIIVLEDGKITQMGNHDKLSKEEGLYKKIWDIQQNIKEGDNYED